MPKKNKPTWATLEEEVRAEASVIWGRSFASQLVHGRQIDAYSQSPTGDHVAIEVTEQKNINKVQEDIGKLVHVRNANFGQQSGFRSTKCVIVTLFEPTISMRSACASISIDIYSIEEFRKLFLPFEEYADARRRIPFGSAVDPETGKPDPRQYVKVQFLQEERLVNASTVADGLVDGHKYIVVGEYGTGKSKFFEYTFNEFAASARSNSLFPIAIDLRRVWGLRDRYEILRRHLHDVGLAAHEQAFIRAYSEGYLLIMLDGFDEVAAHSWSDDPVSLRNLRADALSGARDLISNQSMGVIVCGRDHYFDSHDEMKSALGLASADPTVLETKDEFSQAEIEQFVQNAGFKGKVPAWLPKKPLTCEFFIRAFSGDLSQAKFASDSPDQFWEVYFSSVCEREARLNPGFDAAAIGRVLVSVAAATRTKPQDVGPISLAEIRQAFERAVGYTPVDQASVLLQRLSGLGRTAADSEDRRFVDTYLLEGLRALHDLDFVLKTGSDVYLSEDWVNPVGEYGRGILAQRIADRGLEDDARAFCLSAMRHKNHTLIADIASALLIAGETEIDFSKLALSGASIGRLDFSNVAVSNLFISNSIINTIELPSSSPKDTTISQSIISLVNGVSAVQGMPEWFTECEVDNFTSVANTSRIKTSSIKPAEKVLVAILHKTFFQPGSARKEEALLRGLGKFAKPKTVSSIINKLISEGIITEERGDSGRIYAPVRSQMRRVGKIVSELNMSQDEIWKYVSTIDKS
ncbi:MAG TPA: hypothetical protein VGV07_02155 [Devosia sp.]|uniref:hypothetical protein n=1 Tax=Devosia sp. TaxID=1871048 RepID=UPI002DDD29B7|nr:hypothetical protein [Devosia sp.]HEV2514026.1 hypothetical protein [Devosia sp.]